MASTDFSAPLTEGTTMSDRNFISTEPTLAMRHEMQIEALTAEGLTREERVKRFAAAAQFNSSQTAIAMMGLTGRSSAAYAIWTVGDAPHSLFADLPAGCLCPVYERRFSGIPRNVDREWAPSIELLRRFAEIQQAHRS
jgi:hypothetical protein